MGVKGEQYPLQADVEGAPARPPLQGRDANLRPLPHGEDAHLEE